MPVTTLSLPSSPPTSKRTLDIAHAAGLMPIELENGCTEEDCSIESDDAHLTNLVRKHFLQHFGHRELDGIVSDYAENAVLVSVVNGERKSYRGKEEIREAFKEAFKMHPTVNSTFHMKHIVIHDRNALAVWEAKTPKHIFPQSSDTFVFDHNDKISKQFITCQYNEVAAPWYVDEN